MKEYTFTMTRTDTGKVRVEADNYHEALDKAYDYAMRVVLVDNRSWEDSRIIKHKLEGTK